MMSNAIHKIASKDERYGWAEGECLLGAAVSVPGSRFLKGGSVPDKTSTRLVAGKLRLTLLAY